MKNPTIISKLKINGKWVCQEEVPPEAVRKMVEEVMLRAGRNIGFDVIPVSGVCLDESLPYRSRRLIAEKINCNCSRRSKQQATDPRIACALAAFAAFV